jgi:hypothetical protein
MDESRQAGLFEAENQLPHVLVYQPEFITREEEKALLAAIAPLPFREARFQEYFAKRRVVHFHVAGGGVYDATDDDTFQAAPCRPFLPGCAIAWLHTSGCRPPRSCMRW